MRKKPYFQWQKEYPDYFVLMKAGCFYSIYGEKAEIFGRLTGYNVGSLQNLRAVTGFPLEKLDDIIDILKFYKYKYVVIEENEEIIISEGNNDISSNNTDLQKKINEDNYNKKQIEAIEKDNRIKNATQKVQKLKQWRTKKAVERNLPAYCILHDSTIYNLAEARINKIEDLWYIKGIGDSKIQLYGEEIFEICKEEKLEEKKEIKEELTDEDMELLKEIRKEETVEIKRSCKNCMLYISEECCGEKEICEQYKYSPKISKEEIDLWPDIGDATNFRLHSYKRR